MTANFPFPPNPDYGTGVTRRRLRLHNSPGRVRALLCDIYHEMECLVDHDGVQVTAIQGDMFRLPTTSCPGAVAVLRELIGLPLGTSSSEIYAGGRARRHCTHLLDLAVLAIAHASRREVERIYDVVVPDETDAPVTVEVSCNGTAVHSWKVREGVIIEPLSLAGQPLISGFAKWSATAFDGEELEAATVLAKTCLIARGRAYNTSAWAGEPIIRNQALAGACYSYAPERIKEGIYLGNNYRDFTSGVIARE